MLPIIAIIEGFVIVVMWSRGKKREEKLKTAELLLLRQQREIAEMSTWQPRGKDGRMKKNGI